MSAIEGASRLLHHALPVRDAIEALPVAQFPNLGMGWLIVLMSAILPTAIVAAVMYTYMRRRDQRFLTQLEDLAQTALTSADHWESAAGLTIPKPFAAVLEPLFHRVSATAEQIAASEQLQTASEIKNRRLIAEVARLKAVIDWLPDPILICDAAENLSFANSAARTLFAMDSDTVETHALGTLMRAQSLWELLSTMLRRQSTSGQCATWEGEWPDGTRRRYQIHVYHATPQSEGTAPVGDKSITVIVFRDTAALDDLRRRHAEFVSSVSHEMKTPLAAIRAYVELLVDGDASDEQTRDEFLAIIDSQTTRLQRLIENLLNLARIEAGIIKVNKEPRSLNELLQEAASVVEPQATMKRIELRQELSPLYLPVLADKDLLLQAAINLLSNAVKYTPEGGTVTLRSRLADEGVIFEVADTGVGLSPEDCERIFERFYRVEKNKEMAPGTGLGLPLAKHIVEDVHRGKLSVTSRLGEGSTFRVLLPRASQQTVGAAS